MIRKTFGMAAGAVLLSALPVQAAMVSYYLDNTNLQGIAGFSTTSLPDGVNYLTVTIDDEGAAGTSDQLINFTVAVIPGALTPTTMYGIQSFAFNSNIALDLNTAASLEAGDIIGMPLGDGGTITDWMVEVQPGGANAGDIKATNADGFGKFDVFLSDGGMNRVDPLTFSIDVAGDDIFSYFAPSTPTLGQDQPNAWFAAHVAGIETGTFTTDGMSTVANECDPNTDDPCIELPSAWFGGGDTGTPPTSVVPEPLSAALVGSALLGLVAIRRKRA